MINKKRLIKLAQDLLKINSENPPGNEEEIARFVTLYLKKIGLSPKIYSFDRHRFNVMAVMKGSSGKRSLLITPHLDTVPAGEGWRFAPFAGIVSKGKIYGRGATDCKGNLAVGLEVLTSLMEDGAFLKQDLIFLATADEETGSRKGLIPFLEKELIRPAFALILDSDEFDIITAQKGLIHFKVIVTGKRAHGAYPYRGINAIEQAAKLIRALKEIEFSYAPHRLLKPPTINVGTIRGGDKVNMVADWCEFEVDLRFLPGMSAPKILMDIKNFLKKIYPRVRIHVDDIQQPYEIDESHILVRSLKEACREVSRPSLIKGSEGATVITFFKKKNIPAIATGYGARGTAHATNEYARVRDLYQGAIALERFIKIFTAVT